MGRTRTFRVNWRKNSSEKYILTVIYAMQIMKRTQSYKSIGIQCLLNSSDVTCVQRSLQLTRNSSTIGYVCTILLWFKCHICNTYKTLQYQMNSKHPEINFVTVRYLCTLFFGFSGACCKATFLIFWVKGLTFTGLWESKTPNLKQNQVYNIFLNFICVTYKHLIYRMI